MKKPKNFDEYMLNYPSKTQKALLQVHATIKKAAPKAEEVISYGIPAFKWNGMLVWFAAYSKHIGFYPRVSGIEKFKKELAVYKGAKGSVQFPLDQRMPLKLISNIVKFRVKENLEKEKAKKK